MRDRRVGEQALGVGLSERGEVRAGHSGDGNEDQHGNPRGAHRDQSTELERAGDQNAQQHRPSRSFHGYGHESGNARGRAFVGIGRPLMEGDGGNLEQQAGERGQQGNNGHGIMRIFGKNLGELSADDAQVRASGQTVQQREAVSKNAGGKRAEQQILQRRFVRAAVAPQKTDENISGDRHQLQPDEDEHDVEPGGHAHHADDREQHQRVVLAVVFMLGLHVTHGHENGDGGAREEQIKEVERKAVHQHGAHHAERTHGSIGFHPGLNLVHAAGGEQHSDESGDAVDPLALGRDHEIDEQDAESKQSEQRDGQSHHVVIPAECGRAH